MIVYSLKFLHNCWLHIGDIIYILINTKFNLNTSIYVHGHLGLSKYGAKMVKRKEPGHTHTVKSKVVLFITGWQGVYIMHTHTYLEADQSPASHPGTLISTPIPARQLALFQSQGQLGRLSAWLNASFTTSARHSHQGGGVPPCPLNFMLCKLPI